MASRQTALRQLRVEKPPAPATPAVVPFERRGVVYTKIWVVELLLELAHYRPDTNLIDAVAVEPAAGDGAFLGPMITRLVASCRRFGRPLLDCRNSLVA